MTASSDTPTCALCGAAACMECIACIRSGSSGFMCGATCLRQHFKVHRDDKPPVPTSVAKPHVQELAYSTAKPPQTPPRVRQSFGAPFTSQSPMARDVPHPRPTQYRTSREGLWSCSLTAHASVVQPNARHVSSTVLVKQR
ncbi:hypothetical protein Vretimale_14944 [Volvox reticuliferus]|uniref:Uncharacterized protein n=1 Tax=Volvox reticuliferus TaxID=1737510 RepID=A0A8J4CY42_9CHLO|nr:hypothetical protein Vretifemale_19561 [Volvox reticuliferus]GIM11447.1 hypothetical protein Vretimale_14944 [Volvox reticuliferus]